MGETAPAPHSALGVWWLASRPKTLWAAVAPVVLGIALAAEAGYVHAWSAAAALFGAICIQIGTNFHNDYQDFLKGADTKARIGPLRVTQAGLVAPETMRRATWVVFLLAVAAGLYLIVRGGWPIAVVGLLSIVSGLLYTGGRYSLAYLGLGDLFVLVFFGPVAVGGTYYVQALELPAYVIAAGCGPGLLSTAILLINNIRDVDQDRAAGKKTLVVRLGRTFGIFLYGLCVLIAALLPVLLYATSRAHAWGMLGLIIVPFAFPILRTLVREEVPERLNPLLGATARLLLLYSLVFGIGWNL